MVEDERKHHPSKTSGQRPAVSVWADSPSPSHSHRSPYADDPLGRRARGRASWLAWSSGR